MTSRASGARFRQRKLSTKHALQVVREDEIADTFGDENDPARHIPRVETGVERAEETVCCADLPRCRPLVVATY